MRSPQTLSVGFAPVANAEHAHNARPIINSVKDPVAADANSPVPLGTLQLSAAGRPRIFAESANLQDDSVESLALQPSSRLLKKGVGRRCERRRVGCKEPRRRRCRGASGKSGDAADGPAPPQPLAVAGLLLPITCERKPFFSTEISLRRKVQKARHDARIHFSAAC
jgi:hypothetical protein